MFAASATTDPQVWKDLIANAMKLDIRWLILATNWFFSWVFDVRPVPHHLLISWGKPVMAWIMAGRRSAQREVTDLARSADMRAYFIQFILTWYLILIYFFPLSFYNLIEVYNDNYTFISYWLRHKLSMRYSRVRTDVLKSWKLSWPFKALKSLEKWHFFTKSTSSLEVEALGYLEPYFYQVRGFPAYSWKICRHFNCFAHTTGYDPSFEWFGICFVHSNGYDPSF